MSPELKEIYHNNIIETDFNSEKSDLFSLGITFLYNILLLNENLISGLNN